MGKENIIEITDLDILYGRSDYSIHHVGNVSFRTLVGHCLAEYTRLPKNKRSWKGKLFTAIVLSIKKSGGRFLKQNASNKEWEEVSDVAAKLKTGHELRDAARKPHILYRFSYVYTADIKQYFKSAYNFDWAGIVRVCSKQMEESKQRCSSTKHVEDMNPFECPDCKYHGAMGLLQLKATDAPPPPEAAIYFPRMKYESNRKLCQCDGSTSRRQKQRHVHPWDS